MVAALAVAAAISPLIIIVMKIAEPARLDALMVVMCLRSAMMSVGSMAKCFLRAKLFVRAKEII
jgi:hypothetical protein